MKKLKTILTIGVVFAMVFTIFPSITGNMNAYAATPKKITLNVSGYTSYTTTLKWNKCKSPKKGYAVFVDGTCVKRFNTKTTSYSYSSNPGKTHTYQIKVWTSKKQYYNTKTKKWVNKKPKASQWVGKQTRYKYTYSNASNSRSVTNPKLNQSIEFPNGNSRVTYTNNSFTINAYATSGLAVSFTSSDTSIAVVGTTNGNVITKKSGTAVITVKQNGNGTYNSTSKNFIVTVEGSSQTISCNTPNPLNIGESTPLNASASSGLPLTYTSENPDIATVSSTGVVKAVSYGRVRIHIEQKGNSSWAYTNKYIYVDVKAANITIKYNGNGATSGSMSNQTLTNGTGTLNTNTFTKTNYTFKGWNTTASATTARWADGGTFTQLGSSVVTVNLYAIWEKSPEPTVVTTPFTINYNNKNGNNNVISLNDGDSDGWYTVPLSIPEGVKSITWSVIKNGMADGTGTVEISTSNNGKTLKIRALNALSSSNNLGQFKLKAIFEMEDGYIYYDKDGNGTANETSDRTVTSGVITNTVYTLVDGSSLSSPVYNFKSFNRPIANADERSLYVFNELPNNSTININLEEWYDGEDNIKLFFPTKDWEILNHSSVVGKIISPIAYNGQIRLIKAGTFQIYFANTGRTMTFVLTGNASQHIQNYYNHLNSVASQCKNNDEITTIKNCLAYIFTHYTYVDKGNWDLFIDGKGHCGSGNKYLTDLLNVCGIEAYYRNASVERTNHYNTAIILSNGDKYIADGTPDLNFPTMSQAIAGIEGTITQHSGRHSRLITWDEYDAFYDAVIISFYGY